MQHMGIGVRRNAVGVVPSWNSRGGRAVGGVAAHQENAAKPPLKAQTGWFYERGCQEKYLPADGLPGQRTPVVAASPDSVETHLGSGFDRRFDHSSQRGVIFRN